nr:trypsin-like serine protease [Paenibacillus sp. MMS18-CY102]
MKIIVMVFLSLTLLTPLTNGGNVSAENELSTEIEKAKMFREKFGLNNDKDYVEKLEKDSKSKEEFGVALTVEEEKEIYRRIKIQEEDYPKIKEKMKEYKVRGDIVYIDQKDGGKINIGLKDLNASASKIAISEIDKEFSGKTKFFQAKYSEQELDQYVSGVWAKKAEIKQQGIGLISVSTDVINQTVIVGLADLDSQTQHILTSLLPEIPISIMKVEAPQDTAVRGGEKIISTSGSSCSVGFGAKDSSGQYYVITAGHCSRDYNVTTGKGTYKSGEGWNYSGTYLGFASSHWSYYGLSDSMGIAVTSVTVKEMNLNGGLRTITSFQDSANDVVGQLVCKTGYVTGATCGTLKSRNVGYDIDGSTFFNLRGDDTYSDHGDSGGTVYSNSMVLGITKGSGGGYSHVYSQVENVAKDLNVTPTTS